MAFGGPVWRRFWDFVGIQAVRLIDEFILQAILWALRGQELFKAVRARQLRVEKLFAAFASEHFSQRR